MSAEYAFIDKNRQTSIEDWGPKNQEKLYQTKVLILGGGILGQMVLGCLTGLGIGNILIMDNSRTNGEKNFLFPNLPYKGLKKIHKIGETASSIDEYVKIKGVHSKFSEQFLDYLRFNPDIVVDAQNDLLQKEIAVEYASRKEKTLISSHCGFFKGSVSLLCPGRKNFEEILEYDNEDYVQGSIPAGVCTGIIVEEARKAVFRYKGRKEIDIPLEKKATYNLESESRNSPKRDYKINFGRGRGINILVGGAGAIGNYAVLNLALSGFRNVSVLDYDDVEGTNLSRQILFYKSLGKKKASVLTERIKEISKGNPKGLVGKLEKNSDELFEKNNFDLILGCFDNQEARYHLSEFAIKYEIPYIDGGTSAVYGSVSSYFPEKTACIKCKKNLKRKKESATCELAQPSVVSPNISVGSFMVGEIENYLNNNIPDKRVVFDTFDKRKIYTEKERTNCSCENGS